jgi:hypothetical protein
VTDLDALLAESERHRRAYDGAVVCIACGAYVPCLTVQLAAAVRELQERHTTTLAVVERERETIAAWIRGCEQGIWKPTPATQRVLASILRMMLLGDTP